MKHRAHRRPTIRDVAHAARVSTGAVSYALNGRRGVTEQTRQRILEAARELGWRPSASARALVNARSYAVGLVICRPPELLESDPFFLRFLAGVETALADTDYALLLQVVGTREDRELECYERLAAAHRVDGVLLTDVRRQDSRFARLRGIQLPAVIVGQPGEEVEFPWIAMDDFHAMEQTVNHLIGLGHTHIGYVGGPQAYLHAFDREAGWRMALERAGLEPGPVATGDFSGPSGARATLAILRSRRRPTAIVYANDLMAVAGMTATREMGIRIPEELAITGFDDIPVATHVSPSLTTVREDVTTWGERAAELLVAVLEHREIRLGGLRPPQLLIRGSTAPPPTGRSPVGRLS
jgi:DNA-binding LacI/PurR family transcriptional regulator